MADGRFAFSGLPNLSPEVAKANLSRQVDFHQAVNRRRKRRRTQNLSFAVNGSFRAELVNLDAGFGISDPENR